MSTIDPEAPNVLHTHSRHAHWSRANEKGVFPGVSTPMNWSIWGEIGELSTRRGAFDLGLLDEHELALPESADDWGWSIFYGRPTANVDTWRRMYERGLGGSGQGAATQRQVFGDASPSSPARPVAADPAIDSRGARGANDVRSVADRERAASIARKRAAAIEVSPARLRSTRREAIAWWREATRELASTGLAGSAGEEVARRRFHEALQLFERADRDHIVVSLLSTEAVTALATAATAAGRPDAANALMVGYPGMEEFETAVAVWDLSRGRIDLAAFLGEHGFHGSMEGEISSRSWREDPEPVRALAKRYALLPESDDPRRRERRGVAAREQLERELRAAIAPTGRDAFDQAIALAATSLPMREAGRATLTIALDAMRAAARVVGRGECEAGRFQAVDDVFLLTRQELFEQDPDRPLLLRARRALVAGYERFDLPESWQGMPEKVARIERGEAVRAHGDSAGDRRRLVPGDRLVGLGASAGVHEGIARVVLDPSDPELEFDAGDVLVAPATDPSWAPLFLVAGAVVIDTGSNISHAAVVAREMGIPAVVAARDASLLIESGRKLRVDGGAGSVEVVGSAGVVPA